MAYGNHGCSRRGVINQGGAAEHATLQRDRRDHCLLRKRMDMHSGILPQAHVASCADLFCARGGAQCCDNVGDGLRADTLHSEQRLDIALRTEYPA
jgi:hypothetical protein